ncbi:MAG: dienelactone hydrolase family protein [Thermogemmatispora sp.]|uniref:dienelactone hydrolase family protein n=1 Tax=Thermogemmatispora sp. TaxID=1968838 RepID=UPI0019F50416|nr:dienelactone hydrolase family protein [Thermogemmatispora sp.]MBE3566013.1 dienelactone hydrolase family protein [Thermogemmatispora sp.]
MAQAVTQMVTFPSEGRQLAAFLALPTASSEQREEGKGPYPGVVVIHEIYGLNDNIKDIAMRLAAEGYAALAVDLFSAGNRTACMFRMMSGLILNSLNHRGVRDLRHALDFLAQQPAVDGQRLGAIGFCMGGSLAIAWACTDSRLRAIAPFYGMNPRPLEAVRRACPVVGSYPEQDFTAAAGRKLDEVLDRYQIPHDIKIYPGARHSFFNDRGSNYHPVAAQDSWQRVLSFFREHVLAPRSQALQ